MDTLKWLFIAAVPLVFVGLLAACGSGSPAQPDPARGGGEPYTPLDPTRNTEPRQPSGEL